MRPDVAVENDSLLIEIKQSIYIIWSIVQRVKSQSNKCIYYNDSNMNMKILFWASIFKPLHHVVKVSKVIKHQHDILK